MLSLGLLLHLHQPPTQFPEVLKLVVDQSYRPLLRLLTKHPQARLTLNVTGSLLGELDNRGYPDVISSLSGLVHKGQVEITGGSIYHALLPRIPETEAIRQITLNELALDKYLGVIGPTNGFFPPEMGIDERTARLIASLGYQWVIVDESAVTTANLKSRIYNLKFGDQGCLKVVVRNKDLSLKIAFGVITTLNDFLAAAKRYSLNLPAQAGANRSLVLAMDGETFGHHQPKLLPFLDDLMNNSGATDYHLTTVSEIIRENPCSQSVKICSSTWSGGWERWADPGNEIHTWQWQLTDLAIKTVNESKIYNLKSTIDNSQSEINNYRSAILDYRSDAGERLSPEQRQWWKARELLDKALHSDQYWWAAGQPSWHYKLVEMGARMLKEVAETVPDASETAKDLARQLYQSITLTGLKKYGDTVIV